MRKLAVISLVALFLFSCGPKQQEVERYMEDGVEVVVNHLEPYKIKGQPSTLILEEDFTIDTEKDEIAENGLTDIRDFDVDSKGDIYFFDSRSNENLIFRFERDGNFVTSFARKGQGPGELQWISRLSINKLDEITAIDHVSRKFLIFGNDGSLIRESRVDSKFISSIPLENGNYLIHWVLKNPDMEYFQERVLLCTSEFEEIKILDDYKRPDPFRISKSIRATPYVFIEKVSKGSIYIGKDERDYEIWVYDFEGNIVRKIMKQYNPVKISKEYKAEKMEPFKDAKHPDIVAWGEKLYFPRHMPSFQYLFTDDKGRLFVMTFEKGKKAREFLYDIFNPEGIFIGRVSLGNYEKSAPLPAVAKNNRLYCLREKESGYKELVVYKTRWE